MNRATHVMRAGWLSAMLVIGLVPATAWAGDRHDSRWALTVAFGDGYNQAYLHPVHYERRYGWSGNHRLTKRERKFHRRWGHLHGRHYHAHKHGRRHLWGPYRGNHGFKHRYRGWRDHGYDGHGHRHGDRWADRRGDHHRDRRGH